MIAVKNNITIYIIGIINYFDDYYLKQKKSYYKKINVLKL